MVVYGQRWGWWDVERVGVPDCVLPHQCMHTIILTHAILWQILFCSLCAVIERVLSKRGVVKTDMLDDPRDQGSRGGSGATGGRGFTRRYGARDDSDSESE